MRLTLVLLAATISLAAEKIDVKVVNRRHKESDLTHTVYGYSYTNAQANANCGAAGNTANCTGSSSRQTVSTPSQTYNYTVQGAALILELPDGRQVLVNCNSKGAIGPQRRSCRIPMVDEFQAEFKGDDAKLFWPVSIDGKEKQSETYKIVGVIEPTASDSQ